MALPLFTTFPVICLTSVFFRVSSERDAVTVVGRMFAGSSKLGLRAQLVAVTSAISPVELFLAVIAVPLMLWSAQGPLLDQNSNGDRGLDQSRHRIVLIKF
jgi:hypothetical protein